LDYPVQRYPMPHVIRIEENLDKTLILQRTQNSVKIQPVKTLLPDKKLQDYTSSSFLMKYIFDILENKESSQADIIFAVDVYAVFLRNGFVDSYFDKEGLTMLHILVEKHSSEAFSKLFLQEAGPIAYLRKFDGTSPLKQAKEASKMQHVKVIVDYFAQRPDKINLDNEDFLILMDIELPEAKKIIYY
jgi:hypothetical protein